MTIKFMILLCALLAALVTALAATSGERVPAPIPNSVKAAVGRVESGAKGPCYYLGYAGYESYYWQAPNPGYGDQPYAQRFTVTEPETLVSVDVWIYYDWPQTFGNDDVYITVYDDDGAGLPGTQLAQVTLPAGTYSAYPAWTTADFSAYNLIVNGDFHVGFSSSGAMGTDWENCMSDDGSTGTGRSSSYRYGAWQTMLDGWGSDVNFHIWPYLCKQLDRQGACCYDPTGLAGDNAMCVITYQFDCETNLGGVFMGDDTQCRGVQACCLPTGECIDADSLCCADELGGIPQGRTSQCSAPEACCLGTGDCVMIDPICCDELGGVAQGAGTQCDALKPCCLPGGVCQMLDPLCCDDEGGVPSPIGASTCLGDTNGNQINDACEGGWQPGDPHKMHYPQLPDEDGWDVDAVYDGILCDDWTCSADGRILDLHFWGSWKNGLEGQIIGFEFMIYSNVPDYQSPTGYSVPNMPLWQYYAEEFEIVPIYPQTMEGWYDPETQEVIYDDHQSYFQYNVYIPEGLAFDQEKDSVYWLCITAHVTGSVEPPPYWGWKSSEDHHEDDAVYADFPFVPEPLPPEMWMELYEPAGSDSITNHFQVVVDEQGLVIGGGGTDAYGDGWYFYDLYQWWNIWFYDHPFTYEGWKEISIEFYAQQYAPHSGTLVLAVNWSTDNWSLDQPPGDSAPPLPGVDEDLYIERDILFFDYIYDPVHFGPFTFTIPEYNPEWVSVDVKGYNFRITNGWITHKCVSPQSLDLSFVITGAEVCDCIPGDADGDGRHLILDVTYIINYLYKNGPPPVPYASCSGDADCDCSVLILDVTYLINYLYKNGPAPCSCQQWLTNCGSPLRD